MSESKRKLAAIVFSYIIGYTEQIFSLNQEY